MVSVIIPNYNHSRFLRERIDSVLQQSYQDFEIILLDDCSTDSSRTVLEEYRDNPHVSHIVFNEKNSGSTFLQWEKGFSLSKGEYIWIAESDDVAEKDLLRECVSRIDSDPSIQLVYTYSNYIDQDGNPIDFTLDQPKYYHNNGIYEGDWMRLHRMMYKNVVYNASMTVFRKSALENVTQDFKQFRYCGDWVFWFDMMSKGRVAEVPLKLNNFRQHLDKVSKRANDEGLDFRECAKAQRRMADILHLSKYQRQCLRGRLTKRINKASFPTRLEVIELYPELYKGSMWDVIVYEFDKYTHLSGLLN